jgi:hypothetical protein
MKIITKKPVVLNLLRHLKKIERTNKFTYDEITMREFMYIYTVNEISFI